MPVKLSREPGRVVYFLVKDRLWRLHRTRLSEADACAGKAAYAGAVFVKTAKSDDEH